MAYIEKILGVDFMQFMSYFPGALHKDMFRGTDLNKIKYLGKVGQEYNAVIGGLRLIYCPTEVEVNAGDGVVVANIIEGSKYGKSYPFTNIHPEGIIWATSSDNYFGSDTGTLQSYNAIALGHAINSQCVLFCMINACITKAKPASS
jgi:hypothetical protein